MVIRKGKVLSLCLCLMMFFSFYTSVFAQETIEEGTISALELESRQSYEDIADTIETDPTLPEKFDLRTDLSISVVTSVKNQGLWGDCWAFSSISAIETSLIYEFWAEKGIDLSSTLDLSELQLSWFAETLLPESETAYASQAGEGTSPLDPQTSPLNTGGGAKLAASILANGIGPVTEEAVPYQNKSGNLVNLSTTEEYYVYAADGEDWSVAEDERFSSLYELEEASFLPTPANLTKDEDGNLVYSYNAAGTEAIKQELYAGRAVSIGFLYPGESKHPDSAYSLNSETMAIYNSSPSEANHEVCIVGWDDTYSRENFGSEENPSSRPENDGAWICKNSWGSLNSTFPNISNWGYEGSGYFYISYEDESFDTAVSFNFNLDTSTDEVTIEQYDLMPTEMTTAKMEDEAEASSMANLFTADSDASIVSITGSTTYPGSKISYQIYRLNENYTSPTDGQLVASGEKTFSYGGIHQIELSDPVSIQTGESYSIVMTASLNGENYIVYNRGMSKDYSILIDYPTYATGIVNAGESMLLTDTGWIDLTEKIAALQQEELDETNGAYYETEYDNFTIKAHTVSDTPTELVLTKSESGLDETKTYQAGDTLSFVFEISLPTDSDLSVQSDEAVNFTLSDTLGALTEEQKSLTLQPGETKTVRTDYTVTDEDVQNGTLNEDFLLKTDAETYRRQSSLSYSAKLSEKASENASSTTDSAQTSSGVSSGTASGSNAATGLDSMVFPLIIVCCFFIFSAFLIGMLL